MRDNYPDYYSTYVGFAVTISPPYFLKEIIEFVENITTKTQPVFLNFLDPFDTTFFNNFDMKKENRDVVEQQNKLFKYFYEKKINNIKDLKVKLLEESFARPILRIDKRQIYNLEKKSVHPNSTCYPGLDRLFITTEGRLGICEKLGGEMTFGDVQDGIDYDKVNKIFNDYSKIVDEVCLDCWAYRLCSSCFTSAIKGAKFSKQRKKENCEYYLKNIKKNLILYSRIKVVNPTAFEIDDN